MLVVLEDWRAWRRDNKADLAGDELAAYYAGHSFPFDLLELVEMQCLSESKAAASGSA